MAFALALAGCATAPPADPFASVAADVARVSGHSVTRDPDRDAPATRARIAAWLAAPLQPDAAVGIALLNNPGLQARFARLGFAEAGSIRAGLLANPIFAGALRFPNRLYGVTDVGTGLMEDVTSLILRPTRTRIAAMRLDAARSDAADAAIGLIADTMIAWDDALAAQQQAGVLRARLTAARVGAQLADRLFHAGNLDALDDATRTARADALATALAAAEARVTATHEALNRLLGLSGPQTAWTLPAALPDPPPDSLPYDRLEQIAVTDNFHLASLRHTLLAEAQTLGLARRFGWLTDLQFGIDTEKNPENYRVTGPELVAPLPIFDHGQADLLRAATRLAEANDRLIESAIDVRARVRVLRDRLLRARALVGFYRTRILPQRQQILALAVPQYRFMLLGPFDLLRLKQNVLIADQGAIDADLAYWNARAELGRALGGAAATLNPAGIPVASNEAVP